MSARDSGSILWDLERRMFVFPADAPPTPQCHASTIAALPDGTLLAAWFAGTKERHSDTHIRVARCTNGVWEASERVADGLQANGVRWPCWNPVLHCNANGEILLFFKVGPSPREWWGEMLVSRDGGRTWGDRTRLPAGFFGPIKNKPIALPDGSLLHPSSTEDNGWRVHFERSSGPVTDMRWERTPPLNDGSEMRAIQPTILTHGQGRLHALCRTANGFIAEAFSRDWGRTWTRLRPTALPNPNSGIDAVTLGDGGHLLVYNPIRHGRNVLAVAWSENGTEWRRILLLEDEPEGEFSYPAVIQAADGLVHITYTWRRRSVRHVVLRGGN